MPTQDTVIAQRLLCTELARLLPGRDPQPSDLGALVAYDRHATQLGKRLVVRYVEGDAQLRSLDRRVYTAALRLSRAFAQAYENMLTHVRQAQDSSWRAHASTVLVRLFRHRQLEFLLRIFRYKKRNSEQWRQLHESYRFAMDRGITRERPVTDTATNPLGNARSVEQEFIQILLLDALNTGQFSPRELHNASRVIARWRHLLTLEIAVNPAEAPTAHAGFFVDLDGAEGLTRVRRDGAGTLLHLDTTPLIRAIDAELTTLAAGRAPVATLAPAPDPHSGVDALLAKLQYAFAPTPPYIRRRGDRLPVSMSVQVVTGLPSIIHVLRLSAQRMTAPPGAVAGLDGITAAPRSHLPGAAASVLGEETVSVAGTATMMGAIPRSWQVKDRSDSGCRMRGKTTDLNGLIPGSLIALGEGADAPWTIGVVRRLRRLMVDHVEISVEYIGRKPRYVKIAMTHPQNATGQSGTGKCYAALYLPASEAHPAMPIKTLLLPACAFNPGATVTLITSTTTHALCLNRPLQKYADFVWTSFSVVDVPAAARAAAAG